MTVHAVCLHERHRGRDAAEELLVGRRTVRVRGDRLGLGARRPVPAVAARRARAVLPAGRPHGASRPIRRRRRRRDGERRRSGDGNRGAAAVAGSGDGRCADQAAQTWKHRDRGLPVLLEDLAPLGGDARRCVQVVLEELGDVARIEAFLVTHAHRLPFVAAAFGPRTDQS